jgi:Helix-turn-helix domain
MAGELVTMSAVELDRLEVIRRVVEHRHSQVEAGILLGLTTRQVRRLCQAFQSSGAAGLVSRQRGRPSNHQLPSGLQAHAIGLVRERYADFGPLHKWMAAAGLWLSRRERVPPVHQWRPRRSCLGELVQIDGSDHEWFEERGPRCSLLVYVDDATCRLMELRFVASESAFDYFASTRAYLARHGRPAAFYSDKHSIFRVARKHAAGRSQRVTQFAGRN